ncbi:unhealthy ribosome biogenesis protein 2 homolog isoform X2 [Stegostoma tigrinum]|uniref:unhealthy ribosome biogenesis protein 2 homolog isoform X2 n=1 Tax=Stegostoma tigrinum TaxID=3053191 RepID=UPI00286FDD09|nr:unhealthy ribosome biogenesis protein 2 homolog isoform X2 [Stegostoma tigrinum]
MKIMATIYSGIHLKLKSTKTPWEDKLKLARFAWISHQCFLPNKEQILMDWVCRALSGYYSKKPQFGDDILEGLWTYLDDILHSKKLQKLIEKGKIITLHATIAQIINDRIREHCSNMPSNATLSNLMTVLNCCHGILTSPAFAIIYSSKWELLVDLLCMLSLLLCCRLKSTEALRCKQLFEVLLLAFDLYLVAQRQQRSRGRVFLQICSHLLQPFLLLRHLLSSRCWTSEDDVAVRQHLSKEVAHKIQAALQGGLFHADHLNFYREELLQDNGSQEKKVNLPKDLVAPIETMLSKLTNAGLFSPDLHSAVVAGSVPLLYRLSLESYCREGNHLLGFHIFARFFDTLGFPEPTGVRSGQEPADWNPGLIALDQLLSLTLGSNIYNVAVDKIRCGGLQFTLYSRVAETLLSYPRQEIPAWFRCLRTLILLNHLIVEPNLDDLVSLAWLDADVSDPRVGRAQESLLCTLLETYTKLRQLPRLFQEVLAIIARPAADELRRPVLSAGLTEKLHACLLELPAGQALDIWDLMLKSLEVLIPDLSGDSDLALKALAVSTLLNAVLLNMKSLDDKTPVPVLKRAQLLMDKMTRAVVTPLLRTVSEPSGKDRSPWALRAESSGLLLHSTWVQLDHMLKLNCSKYVSPGGAEAGEQGLHCGLPLEWRGVPGQSSALSCHFLQLLAIQGMKSVMMQPGSRTEAEEASLRSAAARVVRLGEDAVKNASAWAWDGELGTINDETYAVAHWHLLMSNLALLLPHLPEPEVSHLADVVTANLLLPEPDRGSEDCLSIPAMCRSLLRSSLLPEMQPLHHGVLLHLMEEVSSLLPGTRFNLPACLLKQPGDGGDTSQEAGSQQSSALDSLGSHPSPTPGSSLLKETPNHTLSEHQLDHLLQLLDLLGALRLDSLSGADHFHCFVLLVSLVMTLKPKLEKANATKCLQALSRTYVLLTVLQTGTSRNVVFKRAHSGDILEKVMSPLFAASSQLASCAECPVWPEFLDAVQRFLTVSAQAVIERKQSMCLNLEQFVAFLSSTWLSSAKNKWRLVTEQLLITALSALSRVIVKVPLQPDKTRHTGNTLHSLLIQLVGLLVEVLQSHSDRDGRLEQNLTVLGVTALLETELCLREVEEEEEDVVHKEAGVIHERGNQDTQSLKHADLYQRTCLQVLHRLPSSPDDPESVQTQLEFLRIYGSTSGLCSDCDNETGIPSVLSAVKALLTAPQVTQQFIQSLEAQLVELLHCVAERCTEQQFYLIVKSIAQGLEVNNLWNGQHQEVVSSLNLTTLFLKCPLSGDVEKTLWFIVPQIIMALMVLCKEAALDQPWGFKVTVLSLETLAVLVRQGEGILSNPHHVAVAFDVLLCVPLDHLRLDEYGSIFRAIQEVLFAILQSQPKILFNAAPTFFQCFNRLVLSVMHKGRQKCVGDKGVTEVSEVVLECAYLVERMCTQIASKEEKFAMFSSFAVAEYVTELQKVTLDPDVKRHLTLGMYHLLDLVTESDLRFLSASLQPGMREVFKELYNGYTHYHKSKKQGEEKYTA